MKKKILIISVLVVVLVLVGVGGVLLHQNKVQSANKSLTQAKSALLNA